jgi:hypothetical protein
MIFSLLSADASIEKASLWLISVYGCCSSALPSSAGAVGLSAPVFAVFFAAAVLS